MVSCVKLLVALVAALLVVGIQGAEKFSTCNTGSSQLSIITKASDLPGECKADADNLLSQALFDCLGQLNVTISNCTLNAVSTIANSTQGLPCSQVMSVTGPVTGESIAYNLNLNLDFDFIGTSMFASNLTSLKIPDKGPLEIEPSMYRYGSKLVMDWNGVCRYDYTVTSNPNILKANYATCDLASTKYALQNPTNISNACKGKSTNSVHKGIFECLKEVKIGTKDCLATVSNSVDFVTVDGKKFPCSALTIVGPLTANKTAERMRWTLDASSLRGSVFVDSDINEGYIWASVWPNLTMASSPSTAKLYITPSCVYEYKEGSANSAVSSYGSRVLLALLGAASLLALLF